MSRLLVRAAPRESFDWLRARAGCYMGPEARAIEAVDSAGRIRGMVGYCDFTLNAVQCHVAVDSPIAWRSLRRPAFQYPFEELGLGVILAPIKASNARSLRLVEKFGFTELMRIRDGWKRGEDMVLCELRRENCKWLQLEARAA